MLLKKQKNNIKPAKYGQKAREMAIFFAILEKNV